MGALADALGYQQDATNKSVDKLTSIYDQTSANLKPYMDAGAGAISDLSGLAGQTYGQENLNALSSMNPNVSVDYDSIMSNPLYKFAMDQSNQAMKRQLVGPGGVGLGSSAGIGLMGTNSSNNALGIENTLYGRAVDNYNRGYGQQTDLFNYNNQMGQNQWNKYSGLASLGQNAATNMANAGGQYAQGYGDMLTGMANAQASGLLSNDALNAQSDADSNALWAGLAGTALNNIGGITDAAGSVWDTVSGWF